LGIGDWAQSPIPNPQSPIPNPQWYKLIDKLLIKKIFHYFIINIINIFLKLTKYILQKINYIYLYSYKLSISKQLIQAFESPK